MSHYNAPTSSAQAIMAPTNIKRPPVNNTFGGSGERAGASVNGIRSYRRMVTSSEVSHFGRVLLKWIYIAMV